MFSPKNKAEMKPKCPKDEATDEMLRDEMSRKEDLWSLTKKIYRNAEKIKTKIVYE